MNEEASKENRRTVTDALNRLRQFRKTFAAQEFQNYLGFCIVRIASVAIHCCVVFPLDLNSRSRHPGRFQRLRKTSRSIRAARPVSIENKHGRDAFSGGNVINRGCIGPSLGIIPESRAEQHIKSAGVTMLHYPR